MRGLVNLTFAVSFAAPTIGAWADDGVARCEIVRRPIDGTISTATTAPVPVTSTDIVAATPASTLAFQAPTDTHSIIVELYKIGAGSALVGRRIDTRAVPENGEITVEFDAFSAGQIVRVFACPVFETGDEEAIPPSCYPSCYLSRFFVTID